ncbi:MAG: hypothetical protein ACI4Q3_10500 [Kiritimatiellia bacterium]
MSAGSRIACGIMAAAVLAAVYVMVNRLGLIEGLDFGCGQYYYTDIPDWEKYFAVDRFHDAHPRILYFVAFFAWGYLMYRLWKWIDAKR